MDIIEKRERCIHNNLRWTDADQKRYNKAILKAKREMFEDFYIPFPESIACSFNAEVAKGNKNAEIHLDNLCQSYIQYALENYGQVIYDHIKMVHNRETIYETEIMRIIRKSFRTSDLEDRKNACRIAIKEMLKANLIEFQGFNRGDAQYEL